MHQLIKPQSIIDAMKYAGLAVSILVSMLVHVNALASNITISMAVSMPIAF